MRADRSAYVLYGLVGIMVIIVAIVMLSSKAPLTEAQKEQMVSRQQLAESWADKMELPNHKVVDCKHLGKTTTCSVAWDSGDKRQITQIICENVGCEIVK